MTTWDVVQLDSKTFVTNVHWTYSDADGEFSSHAEDVVASQIAFSKEPVTPW